MKRDKIIGIIFIILGIVITITPYYIAPICGPMKNGMFMKCHWMAKGVFGSGIVIALIGAAYGYVCSSKAKAALAFSNLLVGFYTFSLPAFLIGGCMNKQMPCQVMTMPMLYVLSGVVVILALVSLYLNRNKDGNICK